MNSLNTYTKYNKFFACSYLACSRLQDSRVREIDKAQGS